MEFESPIDFRCQWASGQINKVFCIENCYLVEFQNFSNLNRPFNDKRQQKQSNIFKKFWRFPAILKKAALLLYGRNRLDDDQVKSEKTSEVSYVNEHLAEKVSPIGNCNLGIFKWKLIKDNGEFLSMKRTKPVQSQDENAPGGHRGQKGVRINSGCPGWAKGGPSKGLRYRPALFTRRPHSSEAPYGGGLNYLWFFGRDGDGSFWNSIFFTFLPTSWEIGWGDRSRPT